VRIARARRAGQHGRFKPVNTPARKSVVLVDDDKFYTKLLTQLLAENLDCPVVSFLNPREALAALPNLEPGVIVTDYEMPELDGFQFMAKAAAIAPGVPVILITGHPINAAMTHLISASPVKCVLPKPFSWRQLGDEIIRQWPEAGGTLLKANPSSA
jgi:FixJ family two-component response regulator